MKYVVQIGLDNPFWLTNDGKLLRNIRKARRFISVRGACSTVDNLTRLNRLSVLILPLNAAKGILELQRPMRAKQCLKGSSILRKIIAFNSN